MIAQTQKNIVFIGLGRFGIKRLNSLKNIPNVKILGFYDPNPNISTDLNRFDTIQEIIECTDATHVIISTPNNTHWSYIKRFSDSKLKVICEKPIVASRSELEELKQATFSNFIMCSNLSYFSTSIFLKNFISLYRNEVESLKLSIGVHQDLTSNDWRFDRELSGGGVLIDNGTHLMYLLDEITPNFTITKAQIKESANIDIEALLQAKNDHISISLFATWEKNLDDYVFTEIKTKNNFYKLFANKDLVQKFDLTGKLIKEIRLESKNTSLLIESHNVLTKSWSQKMHKEKAIRVMEYVFQAYELH